MKSLALLILTLGLVSCGGGSGNLGKTNSAVVDPSGNWAMVASDSSSHSMKLAAMFNQIGSTVTANSLTASGNPSPFNCVPFSATFTNGTVQNVNQFSGTITAQFGALNFTGSLDPAGTTFQGTYSGLTANNCAGVATSGTFTAAEVPSASGSWTGTVVPCSYNQSTRVCTNLTGQGSLSATLTQDDSTGNVTGSYTISGLSPFSAGTVSVDAADQDILSGTVWQFTMKDPSAKVIVNGTLNGRAFSGLMLANSNYYNLNMTH